MFVLGMGVGALSKEGILFPAVPVLGDKFPDMNLNLVKFDWMDTQHQLGDVLYGGLLLAIVGTLETLISAKIADTYRLNNRLPKVDASLCSDFVLDNKSRVEPSFKQDMEMLG